MVRPETGERMRKAVQRRAIAYAAMAAAQTEMIEAEREYGDAQREWAREYMHESPEARQRRQQQALADVFKASD